MHRHLGIFFAALVAAIFANAGLTTAQSAVEFDSSLDNNYPVNLEFSLNASSGQEITDVSLHYSILGTGTTALGKPDEVRPGTSVSVVVEVKTNSQIGHIFVGSEFVYFWEVTLADGTTATSEEVSFFYMPPEKEWKSVSNDVVAIYYHGDRERTAQLYLEAAMETYRVIGQELLKATLTQLPVKVILFSDEQEMNEARPAESETFDADVTTCGTRVADDIVLLIPVSCGSSDPTDTLRHEFTHILTKAAGESALGVLPAWLDEGTAMNGQTEPGDNYVEPFEIAAQIDRLIPFNLIVSPSNDPQLVNLFYGQSWAMVDYLITQYGADSFAELFATIKRGNRFDTALQEVYGFDVGGFEAEFRQSHGLAGAEEPTAAPTSAPREDTSRPTPVPTEAPQARPAVTDEDDGIGTGLIIVIGATMLFALMAVFFYLVSMMLSSGRDGDGGD